MALATHGEHQQEAEQRHENARQKLDDERVDPEVDGAQSHVDNGCVRLTRRRHYVTDGLMRCRVRDAGDVQCQIVGNQYDGGGRTYQQHNTPTRLEVVSSSSGGSGPSVGRSARHIVAERGQRDGDPDGRRMCNNGDVRVDET